MFVIVLDQSSLGAKIQNKSIQIKHFFKIKQEPTLGNMHWAQLAECRAKLYKDLEMIFKLLTFTMIENDYQMISIHNALLVKAH